MRKAELIKLGHGKYGELIVLLREFLNLKEIKKLKDDDISYEQFKNFLKTKKKSHLLNEENLNQSFIGRDIRTWYNSEQPIHQVPNEIIPTMIVDFLSVKGLASLRLADRFFNSAISAVDIQKKRRLATRDYSAKPIYKTLLIFDLYYLNVHDFLVLPNNTIAIAGNQFDDGIVKSIFSALTSFTSADIKDQVRIFDIRTKKEIKRLELNFDAYDRRRSCKLFLSQDNHLVCESNTHFHLWDITTWKLIKTCELTDKGSNYGYQKTNSSANGYVIDLMTNQLTIYNKESNTTAYLFPVETHPYPSAQFLPSGNVAIGRITHNDFDPHYAFEIQLLTFPELTLENEMEAEQKTHCSHRI